MVHGPGLEQGGEQVGANERDVARDDQDLRHPIVQHLERRPQRIARAPGDVLDGRVGALGDSVAYGLGRRRVDHQRARARRRLGGIEDVVDQGTSTDPVEHLGRGRLHPGAETGGEHDRDRTTRGRVGAGRSHRTRRRLVRDRAAAGGAVAPAPDGETGFVIWRADSGVAPRGCQTAVVADPAESGLRRRRARPAARRRPARASVQCPPRTAIASISTSPPLGRPAAWTVDRAGGGSGMNRA